MNSKARNDTAGISGRSNEYGIGSYRMDKMRITLFLTILFLCIRVEQTSAQQTPQEYLKEQERLKRMMLTKEQDSGIYFMDRGEYELADQKFKLVLTQIRGVPSDLAFYFGKNSHYLKEYRQSVDWLNKYIQLKGTKGQYYDEAVVLLRKSEAAINAERTVTRQQQDEDAVLSSSYDIDCGPSGKVICPVCKGGHVIITKGAFGDVYKTCPYCNEHGILTCEEYNLLIRGELKPKL